MLAAAGAIKLATPFFTRSGDVSFISLIYYLQ